MATGLGVLLPSNSNIVAMNNKKKASTLSSMLQAPVQSAVASSQSLPQLLPSFNISNMTTPSGNANTNTTGTGTSGSGSGSGSGGGNSGLNAGQSISNSKDVSLSLNIVNPKVQGVLATDTTLTQKANIEDPVKILDKDLITLAQLGSVNLGGNVDKGSNIFAQLLEKDQEFKRDLNKQLAEEGTRTKRELHNYSVDAGSVGIDARRSESEQQSQSFAPANPSAGSMPRNQRGHFEIDQVGQNGWYRSNVLVDGNDLLVHELKGAKVGFQNKKGTKITAPKEVLKAINDTIKNYGYIATPDNPNNPQVITLKDANGKLLATYRYIPSMKDWAVDIPQGTVVTDINIITGNKAPLQVVR